MTGADIFTYYVDNIKYAFVLALIAFPLVMFFRSFFKK